MLNEGDRVILKLVSGTGFNSRWEWKTNFPTGKDANAENLGLIYGEGVFIVGGPYKMINIVSKPMFVEGGAVVDAD